MKCPHCSIEIHPSPTTFQIGRDDELNWAALTQSCPACKRYIIHLLRATSVGAGPGAHAQGVKLRIMGYPRGSSRPNPPTEVPEGFAQDYKEAALVLADSPKASAALSRRCMQHVLREKAGVKPGTLAHEIDEVLAMGILTSAVAGALDAAREIGNFAAHPTKSEHTGEVVDVEPGEAEWNLDVLDGLFDVFFVQPARLTVRKAALNEKLKAAGKKPLD